MAAAVLAQAAVLLHLGQLVPWFVALYVGLAGVAVLPGMWSGLWSDSAPHTVPGALTAALTDPPSVTSHTYHPRHVTLPPITPGESSHGSTHATHGPGALTVSPPSSWGET
jgi:hypothetical protein